MYLAYNNSHLSLKPKMEFIACREWSICVVYTNYTHQLHKKWRKQIRGEEKRRAWWKFTEVERILSWIRNKCLNILHKFCGCNKKCYEDRRGISSWIILFYSFFILFPPPQFKPKPNVNPHCKLLTCFCMSGATLLSDDFILEWKT